MASSQSRPGSLNKLSLKDSELCYRCLYQTAQDGILTIHADTEAIEDANPFLINMVGYAGDENLPKKLGQGDARGPFGPVMNDSNGCLEMRMPAATIYRS